MFARKKKNKSGTVSVQIITKEHGRYRVFKTVGCSSNPEKIERMVIQAKNQINYPDCQPQLLNTLSKTDLQFKAYLNELSNLQIHTIGPELIFGTLFDRLGFNVIEEQLFRHVVIARLAYPVSKLKTVDYLYRYRGVNVGIQDIYRFLDRLNNKYKDTVERIAYEYTKKVLNNKITVIFYDMTTLYFETEDEDDLRKIGFSKDGKFQNPQIMLGLLVGENGYPIGYDIFEGNTFEGHTLIPVLEKFQRKYGFSKPIVIADAGLLSNDNLIKLQDQSYQFIIGARLKNESNKIKQKILTQAQGLDNGDNVVIKKDKQTKLVLSFSEQRRKKDKYNRKKGLRKLEKKIKNGKLAKESINNRGYNRFLELEGKIKVKLNYEKIKEDEKWDGLKGYLTNSNLKPSKIITNYQHLWQIEKAFRISKTDLKIRPVYHFKKRRIEAHICIAFVSYTIWKELERILQENKIDMSPKRAGELTQNMYQLECNLPQSKKKEKIILKMDGEQKLLYQVIYKN